MGCEKLHLWLKGCSQRKFVAFRNRGDNSTFEKSFFFLDPFASLRKVVLEAPIEQTRERELCLHAEGYADVYLVTIGLCCLEFAKF